MQMFLLAGFGCNKAKTETQTCQTLHLQPQNRNHQLRPLILNPGTSRNSHHGLGMRLPTLTSKGLRFSVGREFRVGVQDTDSLKQIECGCSGCFNTLHICPHKTLDPRPHLCLTSWKLIHCFNTEITAQSEVFLTSL